ncbi:MAG: sulfatase-like hydrolase/transferase [Holosporales bacterium]|nr:sulfatase-like hydrolase/transferase [Holosporales bacterium]
MIISLAIPFLILNEKIRIVKVIYLFIIYLSVYINIAHIILFNSEISTNSFMSIFETNLQEATEFMVHFQSLKLLIVTSLFWGIGGVLFLFYDRILYGLEIQARIQKKYLIAAFIVIYPIFSFGDHRCKYPFEKLLFSYIEYRQDFARNTELLNKRAGFKFKNIRSLINSNESQTYVIVIGESVNKEHMSIYGCDINTTPNFDAIKSELMVFREVRSAHCHTQKALKGMLCFDEDFANGDIITFFNQAGFKTFWFSNQYTSGNCDSLTAMIGSLADVKKFINNAHYRTKLSSNYDEKLIEYLRMALQDKAKKKIIFLHLMGSHLPYSKRYPPNFDIFKGENRSNGKSVGVAQYNNSILYTDYILRRIIDLVRDLNDNSFVLYFSDHGEDVTEKPDSPHSHVESLSTPEMFDIPFIIWLSDIYKVVNKKFIDEWDTSKIYKTNNLIHSIVEIARLTSDKFDEKKSIFFSGK